MAKLKLKSKPEFELLTVVAAEYGNPVEELFAEAAIGEITIYVSLDKEEACLVCSELPLSKQQPHSLIKLEVEKDWEPSDDDKFSDGRAVKLEVVEASLSKANSQEIRNTYSKYILFGMQPICSAVFEKAKSESISTNIDIDIRYSFAPHFFYRPLVRPPLMDLQEALVAGKLYILKTDIEKMEVKDTSAKKKPAKRRIGPRAFTTKCRNVWQKIADEIIKINPNLSSSATAVAKLVIEELESNNPRYIRSLDVIRQNIKVE